MVIQELQRPGITPDGERLVVVESPAETGEEIVVFRAKPLPRSLTVSGNAVVLADEDDSLDDPVRTYLREIGSIDLLTYKEEILLSQKMERGLIASRLAAYASGEIKAKNGLLPLKNSETIVPEVLGGAGVFGHSVIVQEDRGGVCSTVVGLRIPDKEAFLENLNTHQLNNYIHEGKEAEHAMVEVNLRLVVSIAKKYIGRGLPLLDLIQEGNAGLVEKTSDFSWWRGNKFDTFATWQIRAAIIRAIADTGNTVRLPVQVQQDVSTLGKISLRHLMVTGSALSNEELSKESGLSLERVQYVLGLSELFKDVRRLDRQVGEDEDEPLSGFVKDQKVNVEGQAEAEILKEYLKETFIAAGFTDRERTVLALCDGLGLPQSEVARRLGMTQQGVQLARKRAIKKLEGDPTLREYYDAS